MPQLQLDHKYLDSISDELDTTDSDDEVDRLLRHLSNDALFGLQLRMTPIEFAIRTIQKRSGIADAPSVASDETVKTNNTSLRVNPMSQLPCHGPVMEEQHQENPKVPDTAPEVQEDEIGDDNRQEAPTCVMAKHKPIDSERLRPYLAFLPLRVIQETMKRTT